MREPTREEQAKEAAVLYTALADMGVTLLILVFAIVTLSLTLIGELARIALMLVIEFYSLFLLRAVHRDRLRKFRFGIGKVEQICNLGIGAALVASGFWVAGRVVDTLLLGQVAASPLGLAMAAVVNAINTLINALGWFAMRAAARNDDSAIYQAQLRARTVKLVSSLIVQTALTVAALAKDPVVSIWLDGAGATFVACILVTIGLKMILECGPDLLDHSIPPGVRRRISHVLTTAGLEPDELVRMRTRRAGSLAQVELTLAPVRCLSLAEFSQRVGRLQRMTRSHVPEADVAIVIDPGRGA